MKILAIRGCNLASLAGEFEVDLARGPLGEAGVFAIVGPTGAGKSTLLDAMCAALFDRTPRLGNHSAFKVGKTDDDPATLGAHDVRTLLRRGAAAGWAEVDFESGDRRRYRARWAVRRARGASDGNLQDVQVSCVALDGDERIAERLGGTKTETLKVIHERLGLSFDQFRRSALLAQGEFAAFLRADGKDRSELLERMTGTEIYSRLSVAAHERAALAEQRLREQRGGVLAIAVLADDARADAESQLALAHDARTAAGERLARAEAFARWRAEAERRAAELAKVEADAAAADASARAAEPLRAELDLRRRAEALRGLWDDARRGTGQLAIAREKLAGARELAERAADRHRALAARRERLAELHAPIRQARLAAGLVERVTDERATGERATSERIADERAIAAAPAATWLVAHAALAPEIAAWPELDARFQQRAALADAIAAADRALGEQAERAAAFARRRGELVTAHRDAVAAHETAKREATAFHQRRGTSLDAAGRTEDAARVRQAEIEALVATAALARAAANERGVLDEQLRRGGQTAAELGDARAAVAAELEASRVREVERERVVVELRRAAGYAHARTELVAGEPCPLCGATEHPWQARGAIDALVADAEAKLDEASAAIAAAGAELARLDARAGTLVDEMLRMANEHGAADARLDAARARWRAQLAALGELVLVGDPASAEAEREAAERLEAARANVEAARAARSQAEAAAQAVADALARVQSAAAEVEHCATALRTLDADIAAVAAASERVRGERAGRAERIAELDGEIAAGVARWAAIGESRAAIGESPTAIGESRAAIGELVATWRRHVAEIAAVDAALAGAVAASERDEATCAREAAEAAARRAGLADEARAREAELTAADAALAEARIAASVPADVLPRLLADGPAHADAIAERLAALGRACDRAHALAAEHRRLAAEHAAAQPTDGEAAPVTELQAAPVAELQAAYALAIDTAARLTAALAADDDARARRTAALAHLADAEAAAEVDRVLGQVIGSHDGKLFRSFAQSLTLDGLLAVANSHLEELAPRYQLERVPRHDLELQVIDRDFGAEVRSVQSLSGGESFLVSLALALGLSSMSAHDVRVRTLLIDEGFGTLDPATLDTALAALDDLQATGRQVGVISHVPALLDRVRAHVRIAPRGGGRSDVLVPRA